ncbi:unnamed protein product [Rotaria sp. Silwood1]|nr:unnamed protein product [Rotaria sp. Silwood1]CAF3688286.1 unnamed protein product [Rotaria sp. Silwood1]
MAKLQEKTQKELSTIIYKSQSDLHYRHSIPHKALENKHFSDSLETIFIERYASSLPYLDIHRIRNDMKLIQSIQRKIRKTHNIIRITDKTGVFHIGSAIDYERTVKEYQMKTNAYIELPSNPLMDTFYKVIHASNDLHRKRQITQWQYTKMVPDKNKIELAYLYFILKPHKLIVLF